MDVYFFRRLLHWNDTNYQTFLITFAVQNWYILTLVTYQTMHTWENAIFQKGVCLFHLNLKRLFAVTCDSIASLQTENLKMTLKHQVLFSISNHISQWFHHTSSQNTVANISMCIRCHLRECAMVFVTFFRLCSEQMVCWASVCFGFKGSCCCYWYFLFIQNLIWPQKL